jgi:hypothetical protein
MVVVRVAFLHDLQLPSKVTPVKEITGPIPVQQEATVVTFDLKHTQQRPSVKETRPMLVRQEATLSQKHTPQPPRPSPLPRPSPMAPADTSKLEPHPPRRVPQHCGASSHSKGLTPLTLPAGPVKLPTSSPRHSALLMAVDPAERGPHPQHAAGNARQYVMLSKRTQQAEAYLSSAYRATRNAYLIKPSSIPRCGSLAHNRLSLASFEARRHPRVGRGRLPSLFMGGHTSITRPAGVYAFREAN